MTKPPYRTESTGFDDLPNWPGASEVYSKAYASMEKHGANEYLIESLSYGREEEIKSILMYATW